MTDPIDAALTVAHNEFPCHCGPAFLGRGLIEHDCAIHDIADVFPDLVDAYLRASVACQQCNGTGNVVVSTARAELAPCPGPHTRIVINTNPDKDPDDERNHPRRVLFADPDRIWQDLDAENPIIVVPLPPGWTVA